MSLDIPNLDNKNFDTLVEETINKLPSYTKEWTDYNLSDPGITLIELFAWLNDINYYRLNRITPKHYEAFLEIAGIQKEENIASQVMLSFSSNQDILNYNEDKDITHLDSHHAIIMKEGTEVTSGDLHFLTQEECTIYPKDFKIIHLYSKDYGEEKKIQHNNFYPFLQGLEDKTYFIIDLSHFISQKLSFYLLTESYYIETDTYSDNIVHDKILQFHKESIKEVLQWYLYDDALQEWIEIDNVVDMSDAFTKSGRITLHLEQATHRLKCVLKDSSFYETTPYIKKLLFNTTLLRQEDTYKEFLGESTEYSNQNFILQALPTHKSLKLKVGLENWTEVDNLTMQNTTAKVFQLQDKTLKFGDGQYGAIPKKDLDINCQYFSNVGSNGNILKDSPWKVGKVTPYKGSLYAYNAESAWGGKDKVSTKKLLNSFQDSLKSIHRAVSLEDYEYLALNTPYTKLSKVKAYLDSNTHKNHVTLILVPHSKEDEPQANTITREKVMIYLDSKRLLTTSLEIKDAEYQKVNLDIGIFSPRQNPEILEKKVTEVLDNYLHPITGGKESMGWSFAQDLYLSELYAIISSIKGVQNIEKLKINGTTDSILNVNKMALITKGQYHISIRGIDSIICRIEL